MGRARSSSKNLLASLAKRPGRKHQRKGLRRQSLPKLREERQQGGTAFFDGHVEDGDGKAHYPIKFTIVWDGCPEPVEIIKTIN